MVDTAKLGSVAADANNTLNGLSAKMTMRADQILDFNLDAGTRAAKAEQSHPDHANQIAHRNFVQFAKHDQEHTR